MSCLLKNALFPCHVMYDYFPRAQTCLNASPSSEWNVRFILSLCAFLKAGIAKATSIEAFLLLITEHSTVLKRLGTVHCTAAVSSIE